MRAIKQRLELFFVLTTLIMSGMHHFEHHSIQNKNAMWSPQEKLIVYIYIVNS